MTIPFVTIRRYPYEEPYHLHVHFIASNGRFAGDADIYCSPQDLRDVGSGLQRFPARVPDEFVYEYGSDDPADRFHRHFRLRAYTAGRAEHCALQISINRNADEPHEGICRFSIPDGSGCARPAGRPAGAVRGTAAPRAEVGAHAGGRRACSSALSAEPRPAAGGPRFGLACDWRRFARFRTEPRCAGIVLP